MTLRSSKTKIVIVNVPQKPSLQMASKLLFLQLYAFLLASARGYPRYLSSGQTCIDLCSSCNGIASFVNDRCECNIGDNSNEEADCLIRMRREAGTHGLDSMSCDLSNDRRSTRCTLGFNHRFGNHDFEQLAKYFMNDGPLTGTIFQAPPYTNKAESSELAESSKVITQPPETMKQSTNTVPTEKVASTPPTKNEPVKSKDCLRTSETNAQPKNSMSLSETNRANSELDESSSQTSGNENGQISVIQFTPGPNTPLIQITPGSKGPIIGAINPNTLTGSARQANLGATSHNWGPSILEFLSRQFSPPMLGIPQAIKTVTETPGISELVSAPGNLLNSLMQRWSNKFSRQNDNVGSKPEPKESVNQGKESQNLSNDSDNNNDPIVPASNPSDNTPEIDDANSEVDLPSPKESTNIAEKSEAPSSDLDNKNTANVDSNDPSTNMPQFNYINTNVGSPLFGLLNPTLGSAAPSQLSYFPQIPGFSAMPVIHSPVINGLSPYSSYIPHIPSPTYILSSAISIPLIPPFNTEVPSSNFYKSGTHTGGLSTNTNDKIVGQSKVVSNPTMKAKKMCKKSNKEEVSRKFTRDVKTSLESVDSQTKFQMTRAPIERKSEIEI